MSVQKTTVAGERSLDALNVSLWDLLIAECTRAVATHLTLRGQCSGNADDRSIYNSPVDGYIRLYVQGELLGDPKLGRLKQPTKVLVMEAFAQKANGM